MRQLKDILYKVPIEKVIGNTTVTISSIQFDSRKVEKNSLFVALVGVTVDGHDYISKAISLGAVAVVCEKLPEEINPSVSYLVTSSSSIALGILASNYFDNPTQQLKLIGITGTNGKTTTATLLYNLFESLGYSSVLVSTIRSIIDGEEITSSHTTPDILTLNKIFREAVDKGCEYAFMEVSSHGIEQERIAGLHFQIAAFTNITHDHLDYHLTFQNYLKAKKKFFDNLPKTAFALTNLDDKNGVVMLQNTKATKKSYALKTQADFKGKLLESRIDGMLLEFDRKEFWTTLIGQFNAYNLLTVYAIAKCLGQEEMEILTHLSKLKNVDGRFETYKSEGGIIFIIDYAHTPDALENVLDTIATIRTNNEKLITVVGCGGDRDKTKRPEMARIAVQKSNQVILTSDNPRTEDPEQILLEMEAGVAAQYYNKTLKISDRKEAIKTACRLAERGDIILIAGKGHESYQDINGAKHHFSDMEMAISLSQQLEK